MTSLKYCPDCGSQGKPTVRGSFAVSVFLLFLGILPGLIYDAWRSSGGKRKCRLCGANNMIPLDSPKARAA